MASVSKPSVFESMPITCSGRKRVGESAPDGGIALAGGARQLRNRIYEFAIADTDTSKSIEMSYMPIKNPKRYRTNEAWLAKHRRRLYMGLSQACRSLRYEFRSMYIHELPLLATTRLHLFLSIFGRSEETKNIASSVVERMKQTLPGDGVNIFDFLELLPMIREKEALLPYPAYIHLIKMESETTHLLQALCYNWCCSTRSAYGITKVSILNFTVKDQSHAALEIDMVANHRETHTEKAFEQRTYNLICNLGLDGLYEAHDLFIKFRRGLAV
ncbi:hypothetical protein DDE83_006709 [Stemphylium lycopersici]|uniref:Uncharacterized protein n=1 Tax=Stemphylium lycopersici TaxID=183478 RepID=A0A364MYC7_STELY|nr:hypothetical protein DDE83_006709 [Stemphylium lycopersici]